MPLLALDWDSHEARVAVARRRGAGIVLDEAFTIELGTAAGDETLSAADVGVRLTAALSARQIGRCETLISVGRSRIELRALSLPPSPVEELPELVRFQALRQFANIDEDWPVDFVHLATGEEETLTVLAAAIAPEMVEQIRTTCETAEQTPKHLVLRPFAATSLLLRSMRDNACRLMIELLADEADLTVIADRQVVFMRTVRLPARGDAQRRANSLMGEIRRTMVAAQNQLGGRAVERLVLCGDEQEHAALKARVEDSLSLPVDVFDPLSTVELGREVRENPPASPGRFAPLLGMLLDEATGSAHAIDFLHPRKKLPPKSRKRTFALIGGGVAAAVLLLGGMVYYDYSSMNAQIAEANKRTESLKDAEEVAAKLVASAELLDVWNAGDVVWLDELRNLSNKYPPAEEAIVTQFVAARSQVDPGGSYYINCAAAGPETITKIENLLRDKRHEVQGSGGSTDDNNAEMPWVFRKTVKITPPGEEAAGESSATDASSTDASSAEAPPPDESSADASRAGESPADNPAARESNEAPPGESASDSAPQNGDSAAGGSR